MDLWVGENPWRRKWQPSAVFLSGKSHGQRSLVGYNLWGLQRARHDLATKQQQATKTLCLCFVDLSERPCNLTEIVWVLAQTTDLQHLKVHFSPPADCWGPLSRTSERTKIADCFQETLAVSKIVLHQAFFLCFRPFVFASYVLSCCSDTVCQTQTSNSSKPC